MTPPPPQKNWRQTEHGGKQTTAVAATTATATSHTQKNTINQALTLVPREKNAIVLLFVWCASKQTVGFFLFVLH
jgi:hypothetical protein